MNFARKAVVAICLAGAMLPPCGARAGTFTSMYQFKGGADGAAPEAALLYENGLLYGTTAVGGSKKGGTIFSFDPATDTKTTLYSFNGRPDGKYPQSALTPLTNLLYGTTREGGRSNAGTIFAVDPSTGTESTLYSFHPASGRWPYAGLTARAGSLSGTVEAGGPAERGMAFRFTPQGGKLSVLHSFTTDPDGGNPYAGLLFSAGAFYGTTSAGGTANLGTVFKLDPTTKSETTLYNFTGAPDASIPLAGLVLHNGVLYGTTETGGTCGGTGCGTIFAINIAAGAESVLYSFKGEPDGSLPTAGLVFHNGALYGTTAAAGAHGAGIVFSVNITTGREKVLHDFTGADGNLPNAGLIYQAGTFYGTTVGGGRQGEGCDGTCGTLFYYRP